MNISYFFTLIGNLKFYDTTLWVRGERGKKSSPAGFNLQLSPLKLRWSLSPTSDAYRQLHRKSVSWFCHRPSPRSTTDSMFLNTGFGRKKKPLQHTEEVEVLSNSKTEAKKE